MGGTPLVLPIGRHRVLRTEQVLASKGIFRSEPKALEPSTGTQPAEAEQDETTGRPEQSVRPAYEHVPTLALRPP